ncbi:MAG: polyamine aminopropyltransferase [Armatimonadetes bacterium]|nr:polyamine aminopropyltransferase [Armatimonadota bacterium]
MPRILDYPIRSGYFAHRVQVEETVCDVRTPFQRVEVVETVEFGRMLLLDGHIQLATRDEHAYHEALVQVPLLTVRQPKRALVVGGGDGGVLREICRHPSIEQVDMVEIDGQVVDLAKQHLPSLSDGAFDDPRVNLVVGDAFPWVAACPHQYDLIVVDATDTYEDEEGELSEMLFTETFYRDCLRLLSDDGFVVTQADNPMYCPYSLDAVVESFEKVFPRVGHYWGLVPSFGGFSAYCWASKGAAPATAMPANKLGLRYLSETTYSLGSGPLPF